MQIRKRPAMTVTFLRMDENPHIAKPDLAVTADCPIPPQDFIALYQTVGADYHWIDMLALSPEALADYCAKGKTLFRLMDDKTILGFFVLSEDRNHTELAYFGLTPSGRGQNLGAKLLDYAIATAWARDGVTSMGVDTCTLDHPRALPLYLSRGFVITHKEERPALG